MNSNNIKIGQNIFMVDKISEELPEKGVRELINFLEMSGIDFGDKTIIVDSKHKLNAFLDKYENELEKILTENGIEIDNQTYKKQLYELFELNNDNDKKKELEKFDYDFFRNQFTEESAKYLFSKIQNHLDKLIIDRKINDYLSLNFFIIKNKKQLIDIFELGKYSALGIDYEIDIDSIYSNNKIYELFISKILKKNKII